MGENDCFQVVVHDRSEQQLGQGVSDAGTRGADDRSSGSALRRHDEWGPGLHEDGFGIGAGDDLEPEAGFTSCIGRLRSGPGRLWWIVEGDVVLGGIALRAPEHSQAEKIGHLGYGIRPSARGRGVASWAPMQVLIRARAGGRAEVFAVCRDANIASIRTVEKCGGRQVAIAHLGATPVRHYLFELG